MKIAILPGDGIGVEIVAEAVRVLERLRSEGLRPGDRDRADRRRRLRRGKAAVAGRHARAGAPRRCDPARRGRRPALRHAAARAAARAGHPRHTQGARPVREPASGDALSGARRRVDAQARGRRRARPDDRARADRRHLLRPAARTPQQRRRRSRGLRHDALQRAGDPAHRARRLRDRAQARQKAVLGRQGQRARYVDPVARSRDRDRRRTIPTSSSRTCTSTTRRCSWCAIRSSSTSSSPATCSATSSPTRRRCSPARSACCRRLRWMRTARDSTSRSTDRRRTSPGRTRPIRWRRSCRWR